MPAPPAPSRSPLSGPVLLAALTLITITAACTGPAPAPSSPPASATDTSNPTGRTAPASAAAPPAPPVEATATVTPSATATATATPVPPPPTVTPVPSLVQQPPASAEVAPPVAAPRTVMDATPGPPPPPLPTVTPRPFVPAAARPDGSRQRTITLDPGHGGAEVGSAGAGLAEKNANLAIGHRLRRLLQETGYRVVMTREDDRRVYTLPDNQVTAPNSVTRADLQARIDVANQARADVFVSIHNNGSSDPGQSGTEVWYDPQRPFGTLNLVLAREVLAALVAEIRAAGHPVVDRGVKDDTYFRNFNGRYYPIFVLGPPRETPTPTRATQMPGILGETLFMSNPREAQLLTTGEMQEAIARGYLRGIQQYFERMDAGEFHYSPP